MLRQRRLLEKPQTNMTPMIDVVFLLLTFFVLTFKIIIPEGDFNAKMSPEGHALPVDIDTDSVQVRLIAHEDGSLSAILLNDVNVENFDLLRQRVSAISLTKPDLEAVLIPDDHLHFEHVIGAFTAVNGEIFDGQIRKICDNIKFARQNNREPDG